MQSYKTLVDGLAKERQKARQAEPKVLPRRHSIDFFKTEPLDCEWQDEYMSVGANERETFSKKSDRGCDKGMIHSQSLSMQLSLN